MGDSPQPVHRLRTAGKIGENASKFVIGASLKMEYLCGQDRGFPLRVIGVGSKAGLAGEWVDNLRRAIPFEIPNDWVTDRLSLSYYRSPREDKDGLMYSLATVKV